MNDLDALHAITMAERRFREPKLLARTDRNKERQADALASAAEHFRDVIAERDAIADALVAAEQALQAASELIAAQNDSLADGRSRA